jgi:hypothetical protein
MLLQLKFRAGDDAKENAELGLDSGDDDDDEEPITVGLYQGTSFVEEDVGGHAAYEDEDEDNEDVEDEDDESNLAADEDEDDENDHVEASTTVPPAAKCTWEIAGGNTDCGVGTSRKFGGETYVALDDCKTACENTNGCTDITWAPSNSACALFDGCENAGTNQAWTHHACTTAATRAPTPAAPPPAPTSAPSPPSPRGHRHHYGGHQRGGKGDHAKHGYMR